MEETVTATELPPVEVFWRSFCPGYVCHEFQVGNRNYGLIVETSGFKVTPDRQSHTLSMCIVELNTPGLLPDTTQFISLRYDKYGILKVLGEPFVANRQIRTLAFGGEERIKTITVLNNAVFNTSDALGAFLSQVIDSVGTVDMKEDLLEEISIESGVKVQRVEP